VQAVQEAVTRIRLDTSSIQPAAAQASRAIGSIGQSAQVSAAQTRNAMRQLPAQFTDIATQLASGQSIGLVLLQQGGQIRDAFGSIGGALRGIASLLSPVRLALLGVAGAAASVAAAFSSASREQDAIVRGLVLSGRAAGVTADQVNEMARAQDRLAGTRSEAAAALTTLASSGAVAAAQLAGATDAAIRMQRAGGPAVQDTVKKFIELGRDPVGAVARLNREENFLTESVYKQIRALEERGQRFEAAAVAQEAYTRATLARAAELEEQLGSIQRLWRSITDAAKEAWDEMLKIGRPQTLQQQLDAAIKQLEAIDAEPRRGANPLQGQARREAMRQRIDDLRRQIYEAGEMAAAEQAKAQRVQQAIDDEQKRRRERAPATGARRLDAVGLDAAAKDAMAAINSLDETKLEALSAQLDKLFEYRATGLFGPEIDAAIQRTRDQFVELADKIRAASLPPPLPNYKSEFLRSEKAAYEETERFLREQGERAAAELARIAEKARENFQSAIGDVFMSAFQGQFRSIEQLWKTTVQRMVAEAAAADLTAWLFGKGKGGNLAGMFEGWGAMLSRGLAAIFGGARASGGPVQAGRAYLVGERGPELLVMGGRDGHIVPNDAIQRTREQLVERGDERSAARLLAALSDPKSETVRTQRAGYEERDRTAWLFGKGGLLSKGFAAVFGGHRASGGPVQAGKTYVVGERGPELLLMGGRGGHIVSNAALAGGGVVVQTSTTNHIDSRTDQATIAQLLAAQGRRTEENIWRQLRARGLA
jgi:phage-related minor tail protein